MFTQLFPSKQHRRQIASILIVLAVINIALWVGVFTPAAEPAIYFLDIGQGDSSLIILSGGAKILIDGGPKSTVVDQLAAVLPAHDRYLDLVVMTHTDLDHLGGLVDVLATYEVGAFIGTGRKADTDEYQALTRQLAARNIPYVRLAEGDSIQVGDERLSVLAPNLQESLSGEPNEASLVLLLDSPHYRALFTGDIGFPVEGRLAKEYDLRADILKVGHHGSKFSSSDAFLAAVRPRAAAIGVGQNRYGHPSPDALERLSKVTANIFRTDQQGTIKITREGESLRVFAQTR